MKREFLQNFRVGGARLPKEVINAILDENSRNITAIKKRYADYDTVKAQLADANRQITDFKAMDLDAIQKSAHVWKKKFEDAQAAHTAEMAQREFSALISREIRNLKGKSVRAISALLDIEVLKQSENQAAAVKAALESVQIAYSYLFETEQIPPPYAAGTGTTRVIDGTLPLF